MSVRLVSNAAQKSLNLHWLDLRASGLSILERLSLEEALLRHDDRNWAIVGTHEPWNHKYLSHVPIPDYIGKEPSDQCMVVMGIGGKPDKLLNIPQIERDKVMVVKRFSGGGTVVLDSQSLWTTFIGRNKDYVPSGVQPYPREIMEWSADTIFGPTFDKMVKQKQHLGQKKTLAVDIKSCSATENIGKVTSVASNESSPLQFGLREHDYVLGEMKMGGNAQSIVKDGWLHHTSFLWDYDLSNMDYLKLPEKRPDYRGDRSHGEFLVALRSFFGTSHGPFISNLRETCQESAHMMERIRLSQVMQEVIESKLGGMQSWFEKNRTRILDKL